MLVLSNLPYVRPSSAGEAIDKRTPSGITFSRHGGFVAFRKIKETIQVFKAKPPPSEQEIILLGGDLLGGRIID